MIDSSSSKPTNNLSPTSTKTIHTTRHYKKAVNFPLWRERKVKIDVKPVLGIQQSRDRQHHHQRHGHRSLLRRHLNHHFCFVGHHYLQAWRTLRATKFQTAPAVGDRRNKKKQRAKMELSKLWCGTVISRSARVYYPRNYNKIHRLRSWKLQHIT